MTLTPQFKQQVLASVAAAAPPTRQQVMRSRIWMFAAGIVGALAIFFLKGGVRATNRPPLLVALTSLGTSLFVGLGMWFLFTRRGRSALRRPSVLVLSVAVLATAGFVGWRYGISSMFGLAEQWPTRPGLRCLALSIMTGALPLFAALVAWRRTDPITPVMTGAAFGAGAGLGSAVLVDLWCPVSYMPHLLLGHVLPIAVLAGLGALVGWRLLRLRRY
jgi:hypothetical protein